MKNLKLNDVTNQFNVDPADTSQTVAFEQVDEVPYDIHNNNPVASLKATIHGNVIGYVPLFAGNE